jgi:carbamoyl-phosphate synthase large subunit
VINTPAGMIPRQGREQDPFGRGYAHNVCIMTTLTGARAALEGIKALKNKRIGVKPIQLYRGNVNVI